MRRITTAESNIRTLNGMNNRIMAQLTDIEGHVDEAADIIQGVQENQQNPQGPRERRNVGYNAFAGQGHRIRSPTPTPGEGDGRGSHLPVRPGRGVGLTDHVLPNVPDRVDPSRADRHPIHPDRERADSRSRRAWGLPDRSHSPPGRVRDGFCACARGDISISPNRDVGRNRSPRPAAVPDRGSEVRNRQSRGDRPIRDSGSISPSLDRPIRDSGSVSPNPNRDPGGGRVSRAHAEAQSPGDSWRTPGSRARADIQSPGDSWRTPGTPSDRGRASAPTARGAPGAGGPGAPKICALDDPNDRRHPDAEFLCVTCNREFCRLCRGDDGDCCNCHFLKMKCWACRKSAQEVSAAAHDVVSFGDLTAADTMVLRGLKDRGEADAIVFYDLATDYLEVLPVQSRSRSNTLAFRRFAGGQTLKLVYSDQAPELKNAVTTLGALHRLSTPGMPKTNGLIENKVKLVLHGARVLLRQAGFEPRWCPFAVIHFSMSMNVENRAKGSPWVRRHGDANFSRIILLFVWSTSTPLLPKFAAIERGSSKRPKRLQTRWKDHWIANEDEKVLIRVHVEARTELFIPIGTSCPVKIKDLGRRRSTVLNYLDGSTEFVADENWLQAENDRGGNHEWTGETHFDCDFDQIDEDEAEIYENEEYEPECNDEPDFVPIDEVEVEETSVTTALPAEKKERDFIKIEEDPKFAPSSKPGLFLGYRLEPGGLWKGDYLVAHLEHIQRVSGSQVYTRSSASGRTLRSPTCSRCWHPMMLGPGPFGRR